MRVRVVFAAIAVAAVLAGTAEAAPRYTALGDSFAAGPLIPLQLSPLGCLKSSNNYGRIAQRTLLYAEYRDATCSGARTDHMFVAQNVSPGPNPPQLDSLSAETELVTVNIGGNDIGFSELAQNCVSILPFGSPCRDRYTRNGDEISARILAAEPKVDAVLDGIRDRAPGARVLVLNYSAIFPHAPSTGCWPRMPVTPRDVAWLRAKHEELNAMLARQATANEAVLVDVYGASVGRDACAGSLTRWVEPYVPTNAAAPLHPNLRGMRAMAAMVVARR
jgi:lysophospholipase L1-like esterase